MKTIFLTLTAGVVATAACANENPAVEKARDALMSRSHSVAIQLAADGISDATMTPVDKAKLMVIRGEAVFDQNPFNASLASVDMVAAVAGFSIATDTSKSALQTCAIYGNVFSYLALADVRLRRLREALEDAQKAVLCEPDGAFAQFALGDVQYAAEEPAKAVDAYSTAIKLKPDYGTAYAHRAQNYENLHDLEKAVADYNEVLRLSPDDASTYNNRGTALWGIGRTDEALADVSKAIELDPRNFMAYLNRAGLHYSKADFKAAREDWNAGKAILDTNRSDLEKGVGPKAMAWFDYGFAEMKEKLDDAPK